MASLISSPLSSVLVPPPQNTNNNGADRPSPFHPSVWGDFFISYNEDHKHSKTVSVVVFSFLGSATMNTGGPLFSSFLLSLMPAKPAHL
ncbi:hypothetical protein AAC387_Pa03g2084 [Persea americana]